ncbi:hypothetical protein [Corallococcus exercitus]|uniref:DUF4433 domain-containing protein n=1 Tax=Corallococcus exercitus TaxID=2316736 RepID=A0A7Y4NCW4_9BACT|nr:hypothetical protein [Corallococcus exercitus]NOK09788.1 hypothetical protein [Corallococcus exercitus]
MMISSKAVYAAFKDKGVEHIYHANSVITSCQFLRKGALLSRGIVARNGMHQTPQTSDTIDKEQSVWFDVFADSVDIHDRARRPNIYGPVLFVMKSEIIKEAYTGGVWVTKSNPTEWTGKKHDQKWFSSAKELKSDLKKGEFQQMLVFRHCGGELPFTKYLREILLDDPKLHSTKSNVNYYSMAFGALRLAVTEGGLSVPINKRKCRNGCKCKQEYARDTDHTTKMYFPKA